MSNISTYMILDDHEIEDNWPAKKKQAMMTTYITMPSLLMSYIKPATARLMQLIDNGQINRDREAILVSV